MGKLRMLAISLIGMGLAASCSASSDSADLVELTTTSTIATTTSAQPSSSTTEASTTTSQAPTTTSEATPTTSLEQLTAEIEADLQAGQDALTLATLDPAGSDRGLLDPWFTEDGLAVALDHLDYLVEVGQAVRLGTIDRVVVESVTPLDSGAALVIYCLTNDSIVFEQSTGTVVDDLTYSYRGSTTVRFRDSRWVRDSSTGLGSREGESCA